MKKYLFYTIVIITQMSCSHRFINKDYVYINPHKEQDVQLVFNSDSTFILQDNYGCNRMLQKGTWATLKVEQNDKYVQKLILRDTTKVSKVKDWHNKWFYSYYSNIDNKQYITPESQYFPLVKSDTVSIVIKDNVLFMNGLTFKRFNGNIEKERIKMLEDELINKIGKKLYIETMGEGISIKRARENLAKCGNGTK